MKEQEKRRESEIMCDSEVAELLHFSVWAFQKRCRLGFKKGEIDLMQAQPMVIGGMRRWLRADVMRVLREKPIVGQEGQGQSS